MAPIFGDTMISQALTEVTLVSYEYITQTPRVYSKWAAKTFPNTSNITMYDAAGATSAAPYYFDPKLINTTITNEPEYLIDGGLIANNPSMWSIQTAELDGNTLPVRLISLGTGAYETSPIDVDDFSTIDWWAKVGFMTTSIGQKNSVY